MEQLNPVGKRPKCLHCRKELRPNFRYDQDMPQGSYQWTAAQKTAWEKEHKYFDGSYGRYGDDRFCGLNCAHRWAVKHSTPAY